MSTVNNPFPHVFEPLSIGATDVAHRIMVTGHTQLYGNEGTLSDRHIAYYRERAKGGAALLILEQQAAHPVGRNYHAGCIAWDESVVPWYEQLGEAVHQYDCKQFVQLFACGAQGSGTQYIDDWRPLWAASRIPSAVTEEMPHAMEARDIKELAEFFARSAMNVKRAGLDGVEIHAAHSQLLGEFLSPAFNKRSDKYGGSVANRCVAILEVGEAIRAQVGAEFTLGIRLSFDEFLGDAGITPDQTLEQIRIFNESGLFDFYDMSGGGYHNLHVAVAPMGTEYKEGFLADSAGQTKALVGDKAKVFVVGRILDLPKAEEILANGQADMVAMTRAHMADAAVVKKYREGRDADVTTCIGANVCISRLIDNREATCFQNPIMGREQYWGDGTLTPARKNKQRLVVIGGGPAGMRFAGTAAARGHQVHLFEQTDSLGGRLREIAGLPTRGMWRKAIDNLRRPMDAHGVEITLNHSVDADEIGALSADAEIVCATGASWDTSGLSPYRPDRSGIPGSELDFVISASEALAQIKSNSGKNQPLGRRVLIVDETGEYLPLGIAEALNQAGTQIEIISPRPFVGADTQRTLDMPHVLPRLKRAGIKLTAQHFIDRIEERGAWSYDIWGGEPFLIDELDCIIIAMTKTPNDALFLALKDRQIEAHRIGDVIAPRRIEAIIYEAEKLARSI